MAFSDSDDSQGSGVDGIAAAEGFEHGFYAVVCHGVEFTFGPREGEYSFVVFAADEAGGGAIWIGDDVGTGGFHGLATVTLDIGVATTFEEMAQLCFDFWDQFEGVIEGECDSISGEIVGGGSESADCHNDIGSLEGGFEGFDEAVKIVSDGGPMPAGDAAFGENSSHGGSVGVSDLTEEKFGSD